MSTPVTPVLDVAIPVHHEQHTVAASVPGAGTWRQVSRFAAVGVVSTVIHLGLFASLAPSLVSTQAANLVALLVATVANTALNRRWTFGVRGAGRLRSQLQGLAVFAITWLLTAGALALLHAAVTNPSTAVATLVVAAATAASTMLRFVAMRSWIFRREPQETRETAEPQYSVTMNFPASSSNTTTPVQSQPSTEPWQTVTSP